jgi:hypothetical protein
MITIGTSGANDISGVNFAIGRLYWQHCL